MFPSFEILERVAAAYHTSADQILEKNRTKDIAEARQTAIYLLRELNDLSYPAIGKLLGRDHTTAIHSYNKIARKIQADPEYKTFAEGIFGTLKQPESPVIAEETRPLTPEEIEYLRQNLESERKESERAPYGYETSEDVLAATKDLEITPRAADILAKYRSGMTLEEIAVIVGVTRERVRQIVMQTLMKELGQKAKEGFKIDVKEYIGSQKTFHNNSRYLSEDRRREVEAKLASGTTFSSILEEYKLTKEKFLELFPQYKEIPEAEFEKKKRWSIYYDRCRGCGTTTIPHLKRGYCEACLGGLRKKRREEIIKNFGNKCSRCGISRAECFRKYKKDFYLTRKLAGESFAPLCRGCFLDLGGVNMANKRWGR
jgi:DNA-directed RNA polymerase specialized sigma24 family protein